MVNSDIQLGYFKRDSNSLQFVQQVHEIEQDLRILEQGSLVFLEIVPVAETGQSSKSSTPTTLKGMGRHFQQDLPCIGVVSNNIF